MRGGFVDCGKEASQVVVIYGVADIGGREPVKGARFLFSTREFYHIATPFPNNE